VAAEDSTAVEAAALTAVAAAMAAVGTASSAVFQPEARSDQLRASFFCLGLARSPTVIATEKA
jgi:hypothetical protein